MDDLDRILSAEEAIEPSAGFARSVMDAVRLAAVEPPPLRFPWGRLAVGLAACGVLARTAAALAVEIGPVVLPADTFSQLADALPPFAYAALAILTSLAVARLPHLFVRS